MGVDNHGPWTSQLNQQLHRRLSYPLYISKFRLNIVIDHKVYPMVMNPLSRFFIATYVDNWRRTRHCNILSISLGSVVYRWWNTVEDCFCLHLGFLSLMGHQELVATSFLHQHARQPGPARNVVT
eukprot:815145-Amphidinium_carterae.1